jgi:predicted AlkP superfamily pyrophosphatase or phosphodiesterase
MNKFFLWLAVFVASFTLSATPVKPTKLVIGIIVDQMRSDYLQRYWSRFGEGGFKRLVNQGYAFKNAHYNYVPTYTGPGHASVFTGSTPRQHGIVANDWFVRSSQQNQYCAMDTSVKGVGYDGLEGKMSPRHLMCNTIGDELKLATNGQGKVFGLSLKDRGAILSAGHRANGAFWMESRDGKFISSSWYMQKLPEWVEAFNEKKLGKTYLEKGWKTLYPIETYTASIADNNNYETITDAKNTPTFPYDYGYAVGNQRYGTIRNTPYGNSILVDLSMACITAEDLGKDDTVDHLIISFSTPDIVAHFFGPRSVEVEDVYLRLDKEIERLLNFLDAQVGKGQYTLFLTADHGGADVPVHLQDLKMPGDYLTDNTIKKALKKEMTRVYGDSLLVAAVENAQVFFDEGRALQHHLTLQQLEGTAIDLLRKTKGIGAVYTREQLIASNDKHAQLLLNGYHDAISGDVVFLLLPAWMDHGRKGTTHGSGYNYDTHVPLLFYGAGIPKGETYKQVFITQIAPTVCELMKIHQPSCSYSELLMELLR